MKPLVVLKLKLQFKVEKLPYSISVASSWQLAQILHLSVVKGSSLVFLESGRLTTGQTQQAGLQLQELPHLYSALSVFYFLMAVLGHK